MPIYEYLCADCKRPFEELVFSTTAKVKCPMCQGRRVERQMSVFASRAGDSSSGPAPVAGGNGGGGGGCCGGGCGCR
ncbi:MAG: zinc ribbon domain-containing protein [Deltaproteobacteria bacterium]|nr:zinc ribbon domain-containing protein [Deltaproteobacteria bacterium]